MVAVLFGGAAVSGVATTVRTPSGAWTVTAWRDVLADHVFGDALRFSLWTTLLATVLSVMLAVPVARLVRYGWWTRTAVTMPLVVPHLVVAVTAVVWLGAGGLVERLLGGLPWQLIRDPVGLGIVAVYVYREIPFLVLLVAAAWDRRTWEREECAALLGAGWWLRFRLIVWPAIRLPLVGGGLIVAAFVLGAFEVPLTVGPTYPPTLSVLAFDESRAPELAGQARAAAVLLLASGIAVLAAVGVIRLARHADA